MGTIMSEDVCRFDLRSGRLYFNVDSEQVFLGKHSELNCRCSLLTNHEINNSFISNRPHKNMLLNVMDKRFKFSLLQSDIIKNDAGLSTRSPFYHRKRVANELRTTKTELADSAELFINETNARPNNLHERLLTDWYCTKKNFEQKLKNKIHSNTKISRYIIPKNQTLFAMQLSNRQISNSLCKNYFRIFLKNKTFNCLFNRLFSSSVIQLFYVILLFFSTSAAASNSWW